MEAATEPRLVPGFEHVTGHHCGSTALRNLLGFHGAAVTEELAFGLGAGPCFYYFADDSLSPTRFTNGRTGRPSSIVARARSQDASASSAVRRRSGASVIRRKFSSSRPVRPFVKRVGESESSAK